MADTVDQTQQVTSINPATKQKNPKRVAAGKATAEKMRIAREAQKKQLIETQSTIAKNSSKPPASDAAPPAAEPPVAEPPVAESSSQVLTITQWISIISIVVSLAGIYYKREEIKKRFLPKTPELPPTPTVDAAPPTPNVGAARILRKMD